MRTLTLSIGFVVCVMASPVYTLGKPGTTPSHPTTAPTHTTTTTAPAPKAPVCPIASKISSHPPLASKVQAMLPPKVTLNQAATGFKNQGQFIAALHVSQNLGIPFKDLKTQMVTHHKSLGQSIQTLKKSSDGQAEAVKGERQADDDMDDHHTEVHHETHPSISQRISSNPQLSAKVHALLPSGTTLSAAAKGFRSESQFLAALHASQDLKIPFTQIKREMTGHDHDSLTTAIHEIQPTTNATAAAQKATMEASADLKS